MTEESKPVMMTVKEIAKEIGVAPMTVYRLVHRGELPAIRISQRSLRVRREELVKYLENQQVEGED